MKTTPTMISRYFTTGLFITVSLFISIESFSQSGTAGKQTTPSRPSGTRMSADKMAIDSLKMVVENMIISFKKADSLYKAEKFVTADLRDQLLTLDDYRKKLESNNNDFKGENLKLNQSNRILIIFNSLVAVLLVITLVFFLKRLSRKKADAAAESDSNTETSANEPASTRFASFEDRLMQLERLGKLREKGLLSEGEFVAEKQKVLGK